MNNSIEFINKIMENIISVYTVPQIAQILHTSKQSVRELVKSGELKALKQGEIKVSSIELFRFLTENEGLDITDPYNKKRLFSN